MSNNREIFSFKKRIESFKYAFAGIRHLIRQEHNARLHIVSTLIVLLAGWYFDVNKYEWLAIIFCIGVVLITEVINTALENICDYMSPEFQPKIKIIKDLGAAAVLLSALISIIIAGCIFIPKI